MASSYTIKLSGGERECCTTAQRILYSKIRFSAALSSRNIAICTTRSTMCAVSDYERYEQVLTVVSVPQWRHCRAAVSAAITTTTTSTGNMAAVRTSLACTGDWSPAAAFPVTMIMFTVYSVGVSA